jgi:hypothetical protein
MAHIVYAPKPKRHAAPRPSAHVSRSQNQPRDRQAGPEAERGAKEWLNRQLADAAEAAKLNRG